MLFSLLIPLQVFGKKSIQFFDRNGDQFNEEKVTTIKQGYLTLKVITEIDSNKDGKFDIEAKTYFHHDRMKSYTITKKDQNFDGKWDKKEVEIKPLSTVY